VLYNILQDAARWVYASGSDVETRHILFTDALAREWHDGVAWYAGFPTFAPRALASAKNAYRKHLSDTSSDTLKALDDLRKSLSDEISKVTQQTRDLTAALWRDFAIVFTALAGRAALVVAGNPIADALAIKVLMYAAGGYALFSVASTLWANWRFEVIFSANRAAWRERLFAFLLPEELDRLAVTPLKRTRDVYRVTAWTVAVAYAVMILTVLATTTLLDAKPSQGHRQAGAGAPSLAGTRRNAVGQSSTVHPLSVPPSKRPH
jgi:hypothetical protein